jgi:hypothetical protein
LLPVRFLFGLTTEMPGEKKIFQEGSCSEMPQDAAPCTETLAIPPENQEISASNLRILSRICQ